MFIFLNISGTINTKLNMKKLFFLTYLSIKICGTLIKRSPMEIGGYSTVCVAFSSGQITNKKSVSLEFRKTRKRQMIGDKKTVDSRILANE